MLSDRPQRLRSPAPSFVNKHYCRPSIVLRAHLLPPRAMLALPAPPLRCALTLILTRSPLRLISPPLCLGLSGQRADTTVAVPQHGHRQTERRKEGRNRESSSRKHIRARAHTHTRTHTRTHTHMLTSRCSRADAVFAGHAPSSSPERGFIAAALLS